MNTIKITLAESGSVATMKKDFTLFQGAFQNKLLNVLVPASVLSPQLLTQYISSDGTVGADADAYTAVKIGMVSVQRDGTYTESQSYYMRFLKTMTVNGKEYFLYERMLPKEFTVYSGTGENAPILIVNVVNILNQVQTSENTSGRSVSRQSGSPQVLSVITSQRVSLDVEPSTELDVDPTVEPTDFELLSSQVNSLLLQIGEKPNNDVTMLRFNLAEYRNADGTYQPFPNGVVYNKNGYKSVGVLFYNESFADFGNADDNILGAVIVTGFRPDPSSSVLMKQDEIFIYNSDAIHGAIAVARGIAFRTITINVSAGTPTEYAVTNVGDWITDLDASFVNYINNAVNAMATAIQNLAEAVTVSENPIGSMTVQDNLPTTEQLNQFVLDNTNPSRSPKRGDVIYVLLERTGDSDALYKYLFGGGDFDPSTGETTGGNWTGTLIPGVTSAGNNEEGIVEGTNTATYLAEVIAGTRKLAVSIIQGQITDILMLSGSSTASVVDVIGELAENVAAVESEFDGKLDKKNAPAGSTQVYAATENAQNMLGVSSAPSNGTVAQRTTNGTLQAADPENDEDLATKSYVDSAAGDAVLKANNATPLVSDETFAVNDSGALIQTQQTIDIRTGQAQTPVVRTAIPVPVTNTAARLFLVQEQESLQDLITWKQSFNSEGINFEVDLSGVPSGETSSSTVQSYLTSVYQQAAGVTTEPIDQTTLTDESLGLQYKWYINSHEWYLSKGSGVAQATNNIYTDGAITTHGSFGYVVGSNQNGEIFVESNGEMSLNGYDELVVADTNNANAISEETANRTAADTTLQNNITAEQSAREAADTSLSNEITALTNELANKGNIAAANGGTSQFINDGDGTKQNGLIDPYAKNSQIPTKLSDLAEVNAYICDTQDKFNTLVAGGASNAKTVILDGTNGAFTCAVPATTQEHTTVLNIPATTTLVKGRNGAKIIFDLSAWTTTMTQSFVTLVNAAAYGENGATAIENVEIALTWGAETAGNASPLTGIPAGITTVEGFTGVKNVKVQTVLCSSNASNAFINCADLYDCTATLINRAASNDTSSRLVGYKTCNNLNGCVVEQRLTDYDFEQLSGRSIAIVGFWECNYVNNCIASFDNTPIPSTYTGAAYIIAYFDCENIATSYVNMNIAYMSYGFSGCDSLTACNVVMDLPETMSGASYAAYAYSMCNNLSSCRATVAPDHAASSNIQAFDTCTKVGTSSDGGGYDYGVYFTPDTPTISAKIPYGQWVEITNVEYDDNVTKTLQSIHNSGDNHIGLLWGKDANGNLFVLRNVGVIEGTSGSQFGGQLAYSESNYGLNSAIWRMDAGNKDPSPTVGTSGVNINGVYNRATGEYIDINYLSVGDLVYYITSAGLLAVLKVDSLSSTGSALGTVVYVSSPTHVYAHRILIASNDDNTDIALTIFNNSSAQITSFSKILSAMDLTERIPISGGIGNIGAGSDWAVYPAIYLAKTATNTLMAYFQKVNAVHYETWTSSTSGFTFTDKVKQVI